MRLGDRSTDELAYLTNAFCSSDESVDAIRSVLESALGVYQWHYQVASDKQYDSTQKSSARVIAATIELLKNAGQDSLADEVADALYNDIDTSTLTKAKVLSQVKKHMKKLLLKRGMPEYIYNNNFARQMESTFIEWCDTYPLDEAPAHYNKDFEPPIY